jgi:hypothetical protein
MYLIQGHTIFLNNNQIEFISSFAIGYGVEVGVEESIVTAPPDYNSDQLLNLTSLFAPF